MDKQKIKKSKLGELISIKKGKKVESLEERTETSIRYIQIKDLRDDNDIQYCEIAKNYIVSTENDVIIAWDGANAGISNYGMVGAIGSTLAILTPKHSNYYVPYVGKYIQSKAQYLRSKATGATIPHLERNSLENLEIPLPPLEIQKQIAEKLDKIQEIIDKRKEQIAKMDEFFKSVFLDMFGEIREDWDVVKIEDLAENRKNSIRTGPFGSNLLHSEFVDSGIAVLGIDNAVDNKFKWKERRYITEEKYEQLKNYTVYPLDIIITIMGTCGRVAVIPQDIPLAINTKHLACISFDKTKINPYFIAKALQFDPILLKQLKINTKGAIMDGLNLGIIKKLFFQLPPVELQNKFARIVEKIDSEKEKLEKSLVEMETLFKSEIQRSFE